MRILGVQKMEVTVLSLIPLVHLYGRMRISHMQAQLATASFVRSLFCGDIILLCLHSKAQGSSMCLIERQQELVPALSGRKLALAENKTNKPNKI